MNKIKLILLSLKVLNTLRAFQSDIARLDGLKVGGQSTMAT